MRQLLYFLPLLLFLMPAASVFTTCSNDDPCKGQPDCSFCTKTVQVPDPENCRRFYMCNEEILIPLPFDCDEGEVFNATSHECEEGTECEECGGSSSGSCAYDCPSDSGFISSPTDCSTYYECKHTRKAVEVFTCEDDKPFYNGKKCQTDEAACCHCRPYCYDGDDGSIIPDPVDCRKYHACLEVGFPTLSGTCPDGENFDSVLQGCSATAQCNPACRNVVGPDGCIAPFTCLTEGYFAACPGKCETDYYHCSAATGEYQDAESCFSGTVFHPYAHVCVNPKECP